MSTEVGGIGELQSFLFGSKRIEIIARTYDSVPLWDGEILIYDRPNHNHNNLYLDSRIPIQVKSEKKTSKKSHITYSIPRTDLEKYKNDGGVIYFVVYIWYNKIAKETQSSIYYGRLLPIDIVRLFKQSTKKIRFILNRITDIEDLEKEIFFFSSNRKLQINYDDKIDEDKIIRRNNSFTIIGYGSSIFDVITKDHYVYVNDDTGKIPLQTKFCKIGTNVQCSVKVNNIEYYSTIENLIRSDGTKYTVFGNCIELTLEERTMQFRLNIGDSNTVYDIIKALEFNSAFYEHGYFFLDDLRIDIDTSSSQEKIDESVVSYWNSVNILFDMLHLSKTKVTVASLSKNNALVSNLISLLLNNGRYKTDEDSHYNLFKSVFLFYKEIPLIFKRVDSNEYICDSIFSDRLTITYCLIDSEDMSCSKYLTVLELYKDQLPNNISCLLGYEEDVYNDLIELYNENLADIYNTFCLHCISGYDKNHSISILLLAEKILLFISSKEHYDKAVTLVNLCQIKKRRNESLSVDDILALTSCLEKDKKDDLAFLCCFQLLLDDLKAFRKSFSSLSEEDQERFKLWPIYLFANKK